MLIAVSYLMLIRVFVILLISVTVFNLHTYMGLHTIMTRFESV